MEAQSRTYILHIFDAVGVSSSAPSRLQLLMLWRRKWPVLTM